MLVITSRLVATVLAATISAITTIFLSLVPGVPSAALLVAGALAFASAFLLIYLSFEYLIFREIEQVYEEVKKIAGKTKGLPSLERLYLQRDASRNPIRRINQELTSFVSRREQEIDLLKQHEAYRKEFIADISHELRTPLFAAQGFILTLQDGAINDKAVRMKFLKKAAKSLNRLDTLVRDLITLSRIETGVIAMQFEIFDLQTLVLEVFDQLDSKARKRQMSLLLARGYEDGVYVRADPDRMLQVFDNLISNAISYGNEGGWVRITLVPAPAPGKRVQVTVEDNGPGIPEEHLGRVFERFYRIDKSRSKKQGGSGLGLAITKHIIESHQSDIEVQSAVGQGTRFSFELEGA
jgi:two-component system phosphate regulon sensor histidine kinase PhoR